MNLIKEVALMTGRRKPLRLPQPPVMHTLHDLVQLAESKVRYANLDMDMLWRITPCLKNMDAMIGLTEVKLTVLSQILFYLLHLHKSEGVDDDYLHTMILGAPGSGKCLGGDTRVLMYDGTVKHARELRLGDTLMGSDSDKRTITSTCYGIDTLYCIQGRHTVNSEHVISIVDAATHSQFLDVALDDFLSWPHARQEEMRMYRTSVHFPPQPTPLDPYAFGYCYAGSYGDEHFRYVDAVHTPIQEYLLSMPWIRHTYANTFKVSVLTWDFASCYRVNAPDVLSQVLAGIYDAIGTVEWQITVSPMMYVHVVQLHHFLGLRYTESARAIEMDEVVTSAWVTLTLHKKDRHRVPSKYLPGSGSAVKEDPTEMVYLILEQIHIECIGVGEYYGFELAGTNGRFLLADCLVTHNTSLARLLGTLYKDMGLLSKSDSVFRVAKRDDFVAEYLGQSTMKTQRLLESCIGGVLFIDEVYALGSGNTEKDSFAKEAIDTMNLFMSEHSHEFCCIVAGYEDEVKQCFLSVNRGLERRFQWVHRIVPYTTPELADILVSLVERIGWKLSVAHDELERLLETHARLLPCMAGSLENLVTKSKMAHAKRIVSEVRPRKWVLTLADLVGGFALLQAHQLEDDTEDSHAPLTMYA
jgi:hypothetical protein